MGINQTAAGIFRLSLSLDYFSSILYQLLDMGGKGFNMFRLLTYSILLMGSSGLVWKLCFLPNLNPPFLIDTSFGGSSFLHLCFRAISSSFSIILLLICLATKSRNRARKSFFSASILVS